MTRKLTTILRLQSCNFAIVEPLKEWPLLAPYEAFKFGTIWIPPVSTKTVHWKFLNYTSMQEVLFITFVYYFLTKIRIDYGTRSNLPSLRKYAKLCFYRNQAHRDTLNIVCIISKRSSRSKVSTNRDAKMLFERRRIF